MHNDPQPNAADLFAPSNAIESYLDHASHWPTAPTALEAANRYALLGGGKRLRPILIWWACRAAGGAGEWTLPAAAAMESIHAFSLVHDDLPALDNDDLRRGRPTLHKHAGEAMAILSGDALLTHALAHLLNAEFPGPSWAASPADAAPVRLALCRELSEATLAMIHGQVWDTLAGLPPDLDDLAALRLIHSHKTGALLRASCRMGGWIALGPSFQGSPAERALTAYGDSIGLLFQVVDDLIDVTQSAEHVGKRTGKDQALGKRTYPGLLGVDRTREVIAALEAAALAALAPLGNAAQPLAKLCNYMAQRTK